MNRNAARETTRSQFPPPPTAPEAKHYIYIENQYIISAPADPEAPYDRHQPKNGIVRALFERVARAITNVIRRGESNQRPRLSSPRRKKPFGWVCWRQQRTRATT